MQRVLVGAADLPKDRIIEIDIEKGETVGEVPPFSFLRPTALAVQIRGNNKSASIPNRGRREKERAQHWLHRFCLLCPLFFT